MSQPNPLKLVGNKALLHLCCHCSPPLVLVQGTVEVLNFWEHQSCGQRADRVCMYGRPILLSMARPMQAAVKQAAKDAGAEESDEDDGGIIEVDEETLRQREAAAAAALAAAAPLTQVLTLSMC